MLGFSMDENKHITVNKGCAAIRIGKLMGKTLEISIVSGRMNLGDGGLTARR